MDTAQTPHPVLKGLFLGFLAIAGFVLAWARIARTEEPVAQFGPLALFSTSPVARDLIEWSVERYETAGLELPPTQVHFSNEDGCGGFVGTTIEGRIDLCVRLAMEAGPQRIVLHELAHAWAGSNLDEATKDRFDQLRGLSHWADASDTWKRRGSEQAAEIIAWGLGDGTMLPLIDGDTDPAALTEAFRLLTGADPLSPAG
jgi:hypothetical protein